MVMRGWGHNHKGLQGHKVSRFKSERETLPMHGILRALPNHQHWMLYTSRCHPSSSRSNVSNKAAEARAQVKTVPPLGPMRLGFYVAFIALLALFFTVTLPSLLRQSLSKAGSRAAAQPEQVSPSFPLLLLKMVEPPVAPGPPDCVSCNQCLKKVITGGKRVSPYISSTMASTTLHLSAEVFLSPLLCPLLCGHLSRTDRRFLRLGP